MATSGSEPPNICPVMVPGKAMSPITAIDAMVGLKLFISAFFINGSLASDGVAPLAR